MSFKATLRVLLGIALFGSCFSPLITSAAITPLAYYRLGEADAGAISGNTGNATTIDSAGGNNLTRSGSPVYTAPVASSAFTSTGSTLGVSFGNPNTANVYRTTTPIATGGSNFGMEGWFKVSSLAGNQVLAINGTGGANGYALMIIGGQLQLLRPGIGTVNFGFTPTLDTWFYTGFVNSAGVNTGYVNNTTPISLGSFSFNSPTTEFSIGGQATQNFMQGAADEVRVFSFTAGQFSTSDLLIAQVVPEPSTLVVGSMMALGFAATALRRRKRAS